ncbi:hypothetical protein OESDEN_23146 [Oesophagostomum dentatum]|uniref:Uncharacterized protein n=1 Tax=Oesophagostomum dentatum TaxID=61180 RepID=A0A0B1RX36_OESDE|nr:hypothetical protein OESDEN_23146 [Oesophagostomum dentatum]
MMLATTPLKPSMRPERQLPTPRAKSTRNPKLSKALAILKYLKEMMKSSKLKFPYQSALSNGTKMARKSSPQSIWSRRRSVRRSTSWLLTELNLMMELHTRLFLEMLLVNATPLLSSL